jgi:PAB-dependent poly(A)-specific ribonuclease subunit 2
VLGKDIQTDNHNSIEDAQTALLLYKKYLEIKADGTFEKVLEEVYAHGAIHNFRPPISGSNRQ